MVVMLVMAFALSAGAASVPDLVKYEGRTIASVEVVFEGAARDSAAEAELRAIVIRSVAPNSVFSIVLVRRSLQDLFESGQVANVRVEAFEAGGPAVAGRAPIGLRYMVQPQVRVGSVVIDLDAPPGTPVTEDELRGRLNLLEPGARVTEQALRTNADSIQAYLRDRGFYLSEVDYSQAPDASGTRATVTYRVRVGEQARVGAFNINIAGFNAASVIPTLKLTSGSPFTRSTLGDDINRIRQAIIAQGYLAPQFNDPQVVRDPSNNMITINLTGSIGPKVEVDVRGYEIGDKKERELLPVKREGSIDLSAIVEGERRLRNRLQEQGYFFAEVTPVCSVAGATTPTTTPTTADTNTPSDTCGGLDPQALTGRTVNITYEVDPGRRFKLTDIRIEGTDQLSYDDVADELRTQKSNALAFIPYIGGYGRGYTSKDLLEADRRTVENRMRELGYRKAKAEVRQGVSLDGDNLIITFAVNEGPLTRVAGIEVRGNQIYTAKKLLDEPCSAARLRGEACTIVGAPYSRSLARADADRIRSLYSRNGYYSPNDLPGAEVNLSVVDLPPKSGDEQVRLIYNISEGEKVFINRIIINGNVRTSREAIIEAIPLKEGDVLRGEAISESERILYSADAFRQVIIRTAAAVETASGFKKRDVIIDIEERKPRTMDYGFGYSTDSGPLGLYEIRHNNLFGELRQGTLRTRASQRQQLFRLEYFDPRFREVSKGEFAPLSLSLQYQRDINITRFFRSTIDQGNFGIVQRLDEKGEPIDVITGKRTGEPTINRFTFNAETQRVLDERSRTILFLRYNYEDVRLFNIGSLLIEPILRPDRSVRLSRLGASLGRDTRDRGLDATRGEFLSVDYALALRQLGGNLSFSKLLTTYRRYYKIGGRDDPAQTVADRRNQNQTGILQTVFAAGITLGLADLFNPRDRNGNNMIDEVDRTLPISERFFSGGSTTLRGFDFEEAGPRRVIVPGGAEFRNSEGKLITLNPFTVPVGGNALAVVNTEARVPLTRTFQVVPFYDGGNVFRHVGDIFGRELKPGDDPNLRAQWTHTVGLGIRIRTPFGPLAVDYGYLLNPPEFVLPNNGGNIIPPRGQIHFRFGQSF